MESGVLRCGECGGLNHILMQNEKGEIMAECINCES